MHFKSIYPVPEGYSKNTLCNSQQYIEMYQRSLEQNDEFWAEMAQSLHWEKPFTRVNASHFDQDTHVEWFTDGKINLCYNCVDRHLEKHAEKIAFIWEPEPSSSNTNIVPNEKNPSKSLGTSEDNEAPQTQYISYQKLHEEVCRFANLLKKYGVKKGTPITIYMPMIPQAVYAMLACARIGAVHSVVFGGFSADSLAGRINDCQSPFVITADEGVRGGKKIPLKANVDKALEKCSHIEKCFVVKATGTSDLRWNDERDIDVLKEVSTLPTTCDYEVMNSDDPLFILYTSGSTGKPKGLVHNTGGYFVYAATTFKYVFDYKENDIFWCTADVGWITGHTYIVYGPLANGATSVIYEGIPTYPDASQHWRIVDKHKVSVYYTAPTAIRSLMKEGDEPVKKMSRQSLRLLGSVGEPINPEAWGWYHDVVGDGRTPIVDTWWQTETGGILITPLPGATDLKPGSATQAFFGIEPVIVDSNGTIIEETVAEGNLCMRRSWPGQACSIYGDHQRFQETYFSQYPGLYFTGDGCRRDEDGYYWITGRVDDVLNVSGHRIGTAEVESSLVAHPDTSEAAVVGFPHDLKGQGIYAFVTLKTGIEPSEDLRKELAQWVRKEIGPICTPDVIQWAPALPKTRSGKIMRRILRKIAANDFSSLGDTSTLADPQVVDQLIAHRPKPTH